MTSEGDGKNRSKLRAVPERFAKFALSVERSGVVYRIRIIDSPVGPRAPVDVDFSPLDLVPVEGGESELANSRDIRRRSVELGTLRRQGEALFRAVFVGLIAAAFRASLERVRANGEGLLLQIHFDEAPETASLPWEALWDPTERAFLADLADVPVVRGLSVTAEAPMVAPAAPPLRILALLPEPRGETELSGAAEWAKIRGHLGDLLDKGQVQVERIEPASLKQLDQRLQVVACDVLHIVAHGTGGGDGTAGVLRLETISGRADEVSGADLARALERRQPPRLVVLSACHGASSAEDDAFDGLAQHLLARGVPAVVAMRTAISDAAAVEFASSLYRHLAAGRTAEAAVIEARRELSLSERRAEWATPVLYLRGTNVRLFATNLIHQIAEPLPAPRRLGWKGGLGAVLALLGVAVVGFFAGPGGRDEKGPSVPEDRCPAPPGLDDLQFVLIEPAVLELEDRTLSVDAAFCMSNKEVSRRDWQRVMGEFRWQEDEPVDWPANKVTIDEARDFTARLNQIYAGASYRLPTDVEWEFAARAGAETRYFFGDTDNDLDLYGNCQTPLRKDLTDTLVPIGNYKPNDLKLYDVHGNVAEWVEWSADEEGTKVIDGVRRKFDAKKGFEVAIRLGGSFVNAPENCAFDAWRNEVKLDSRRENSGFRAICEPIPEP